MKYIKTKAGEIVVKEKSFNLLGCHLYVYFGQKIECNQIPNEFWYQLKETINTAYIRGKNDRSEEVKTVVNNLIALGNGR